MPRPRPRATGAKMARTVSEKKKPPLPTSGGVRWRKSPCGCLPLPLSVPSQPSSARVQSSLCNPILHEICWFTYTHIQKAIFRLSKTRFFWIFLSVGRFFRLFLRGEITLKNGLYSTCPTVNIISAVLVY
jgi:hypothetical protein